MLVECIFRLEMGFYHFRVEKRFYSFNQLVFLIETQIGFGSKLIAVTFKN